jgi:uncharacterized protein YggT (Ycf19 family)
MGLIDLILDLAALLLWFNWRSLRFDPLVKTRPATLVGTLRRAEPRRVRGWQLLVALVALLVLRTVLYRQMGPEADWTPKLNLFFVVLAFRSDHFLSVLLFSALSFARVLLVCYFWLLALAIINRRDTDSDELHKMVRLHLGPVARWPWPVQALLPLVLITGLWSGVHPLLARLEITGQVASHTHLLEQGLLIAAALYLTLQYVLPVFLLLYLVSSYVFLGSSPFWDYVGTTSRNLLSPLRWLPLRIARFDFTPLVGVILILALLHWLPRLVLGNLAQHSLSPWPQ